jgi:hypothetical protein
LFAVDRTAKPGPNAAQTLQDQQFEDLESQQLFLQCLTPVWHIDICVFARHLEEYSNKAHLSNVLAAIQYSEYEEDDYSRLQNPTKTPIVSKDFLRALP